jgi:hypothetical protein
VFLTDEGLMSKLLKVDLKPKLTVAFSVALNNTVVSNKKPALK